MLQNYFATALRNLNRNRRYLLINVLGLGVALGFCIMGGRFFALSLMDSIFKINAGVQMQALVYSALGILLVAAMTIGLKIWQTLLVNPASVLRGD